MPAANLTSAELQIILEVYPIGPIRSIRELSSGYVNRNWQVVGRDRTVFLRATGKKTEAEIQYEIRLLRTLKAAAIPVAEPVPTVDHRDYIQWKNEWITVYPFIAGRPPRLTTAMAREVGRWMGRLHQIPVSPELIRPNSLSVAYARSMLTQHPEWETRFPGLSRQIETMRRRVSGEWPQAIIHGDLFPDNVIVRHRQIAALVDFEDACTDSRLFDLGMAINGFCFLENRLHPQRLEAFVAAYQKESPLIIRERRSLPDFIDWTALVLALWHLENAGRNKTARSWKRAGELWQRVKKRGRYTV